MLVQVSLSEKMTSEQRFVEDEGKHHKEIWGKRVVGRKESKSKGPEEGVCLVCSSERKV